MGERTTAASRLVLSEVGLGRGRVHLSRRDVAGLASRLVLHDRERAAGGVELYARALESGQGVVELLLGHRAGTFEALRLIV